MLGLQYSELCAVCSWFLSWELSCKMRLTKAEKTVKSQPFVLSGYVLVPGRLGKRGMCNNCCVIHQCSLYYEPAILSALSFLSTHSHTHEEMLVKRKPYKNDTFKAEGYLSFLSGLVERGCCWLVVLQETISLWQLLVLMNQVNKLLWWHLLLFSSTYKSL